MAILHIATHKGLRNAKNLIFYSYFVYTIAMCFYYIVCFSFLRSFYSIDFISYSIYIDQKVLYFFHIVSILSTITLFIGFYKFAKITNTPLLRYLISNWIIIALYVSCNFVLFESIFFYYSPDMVGLSIAFFVLISLVFIAYYIYLIYKINIQFYKITNIKNFLWVFRFFLITFLGGIAIALWFGIAFIIGKEVEALQYGILQYIFIDLIFALLVQLQFIFSVHKIKQVYI